MPKLFTWQMVKNAIEHLGEKTTNKAIHDYINARWPDVNPGTLRAIIIMLTVNHESRIHQPENNKPRLTISGSNYDYLFRPSKGKVEKYDPNRHGVWEIYVNEKAELDIRKIVNSVSTIYTPSDIVWIKNVSNTIDGEAYLNLTENDFVLHFPTHHKGNVLSVSIGELILIYQKVHGVPAFTHLVTPVDNVLLTDDTRPSFRYGRRVKIIAKTTANNLITISSTIWDQLNFSGFSQGNTCRIDNISAISDGDPFRLDVWQRFSSFFVPAEQQSIMVTNALVNEIESTNPELTVSEGELKLVKHLARERNRLIVNEKKQQAINNNTLFCEVCSFSFINVYNASFIECHHIIPISTPGRAKETTLNDLALVCSNCHRMLHVKFNGEYLTIAKLQERLIELSKI